MIDCPALHERCHDKGYPFGERVPAKVRPTRNVYSDFAWLRSEAAPVAYHGRDYEAWTNSYGAVSAVVEDGQKLGLRPDEFEVIEWHECSPSEVS